jgi:hypothetical protein
MHGRRVFSVGCSMFSLFDIETLFSQSHLYPAHGVGAPGLGLSPRQGHPSEKKGDVPIFFI